MIKFLLMSEFKTGNNKEYEMEAIQNSEIYAKKVDGHLLGLSYFVVWKNYLKKENT